MEGAGAENGGGGRGGGGVERSYESLRHRTPSRGMMDVGGEGRESEMKEREREMAC